MRKFSIEVRDHVLCLIIGAAVSLVVATPIFYFITFLESL